ncbi:MAG: SUMF1/EgtB/PvdO family nonheme iron enzyme [Thermoanaerobaculia bacterium]|nr:SUMF1/EgtB/PvdO family nonheme iron enzyme [Thermoanaerobaculia bacterium]
MTHPLFPDGLSAEQLVAWYRRGRDRTLKVFAIPNHDAYYSRPIALRNPIVFYEGHLPAFAINTLVKRILGQPGVDDKLEILFARGIDPEDEAAAGGSSAWPSRDEVRAYAAASDERIERSLREAALQPEAAEGIFTILEHEPMHQETLLYMFHNMPHEQKSQGDWIVPLITTPALTPEMVEIPRGEVILGAERGVFGWDNEFARHAIDVDAFAIDRCNVTNREYLEYMRITGAAAPHFWTRLDGEWYWRGMFGLAPLPLSWPVYATHDEAAAFTEWRGQRLPSEAEYHRAAFGEASSHDIRGHFDFASLDPVPAGSSGSESPYGVLDLVGNGWEWTSTLFAPFHGFTPMHSYPEYSVDFFDGKHYVLKGASPATARELVRPSFRNWFRPNYPYLYATFRCVRPR